MEATREEEATVEEEEATREVKAAVATKVVVDLVATEVGHSCCRYG